MSGQNDDDSNTFQYSTTEDEESFSKSENQEELATIANSSSKSSQYDTNRVLVTCRRGISPAIRHFLPDFYKLLQNPIKSQKFKGKNYIMLNKTAEEKNCSTTLLFETRHSIEHYLWFAISPGGPTICFFFENFHKIEELHFNGKCSPDTRPMLFFDPVFNSTSYLKIAKQILKQTFGSPNLKSRKFVDTAISFLYKDDHIWIVRYQIIFDSDPPILIEAGPRFCLQPILILPGSFCGEEIYRNKNFIAPHKRNHHLKSQTEPTKQDQKEQS